MKKRNQIALGALLFAFSAIPLKAQEDISSIFKAVGDAQVLANGYMKPAGNAFAANLGSNWYNTAATHSVLGFDLTFGLSVSMVPSADQTFDLSKLSYLEPVNPSITTAPTFGGKGNGVELIFKNSSPGDPRSIISTPAAVAKYVPSPSLQLGIGLPLGTDITFRYSPELKTNGMSVGLWGVGIKHSIKQWIPVVNMLPFDASVMVGYTKFKLDYAFASQLLAKDLVSDQTLLATYTDKSAGQSFAMDADALMANLIISKSFLFFTPYIGVGLTRTNFTLKFNGVYPMLGSLNTSGPDIGTISVNYFPSSLTPPLPEVATSENMLGTTVGFRMKLFFITALHAQYTMQKYPTASVGFGINFR